MVTLLINLVVAIAIATAFPNHYRIVGTACFAEKILNMCFNVIIEYVHTSIFRDFFFAEKLQI